MTKPKRKIKFRAKYSGRVYDSKQEAVEDNRRYLSDPNYRFIIKSRNVSHPTSYSIPFIESKRRTLTNAGLATGAVISENLLDSIAKYADAAGLPVKTAIGLATKESTLGNPTDDSSVYKILNKGSREYFRALGTSQHINDGRAVRPEHLVNFFVDDYDPYTAAINYSAAKSTTGPGKFDFDENKFNQLLVKGEKYADSKVKEYEETYGNNNKLYNAFKFYKEHPNQYNPGQPNYQQLVNKRAEEVFGSPEIQSWYKTYRKRSLEKGGNNE